MGEEEELSSAQTLSYTDGSEYLARCHPLIRSITHSHTHTLMGQHQEQFGVVCLALGYFDMLTTGSEIEPGPGGLLYHLSHHRPQVSEAGSCKNRGCRLLD